MMHRFFLKRLRDLSRALLIPTGILFLCIMLITGASQLRDVLDTTAASTANLEQTLGNTIDVCTSQQEMITLNSQLLLSMHKILYSEETSYTDYIFLNSIRSFLGSIASSYSLVDNIYLYLDGYDVFFSSDKAICHLDDASDSSWYEIYRTLPEDQATCLLMRQRTSALSSVPEDVITVYRRFSYLDGVMVANWSPEALRNLMAARLPSWKSGLFLLDNDQNLLAFQGLAAAPDFADTELSALTDHFSLKRIDGAVYLTYVLHQSDYGFYTVQLVPLSALVLHCAQNLLWPFLMLLSALFIIFLFSYQITRDNFRQIQLVIDLFSDAEKGIYPAGNSQPPQQPDNEYSVIMNNVIRMFLNTTFLNSQLTEQNYKKQAAELQALQLQINPHFMINTLQTLDFEVLKITGKPLAANVIISNLSDILAYSLASPNTGVTLRDDIEHVHKYIRIQKFRFLDSFYYFEEIDPDVLPHDFKRLLLQPLLENSISHGIRPSGRQGMVKLKIFRRKDRIHVSVTDNGVGIPREQLLQLRKSLADDTASRIGLNNVNKRLVLTYGPGSALHIYSKEGLATCVFFSIPY